MTAAYSAQPAAAAVARTPASAAAQRPGGGGAGGAGHGRVGQVAEPGEEQRHRLLQAGAGLRRDPVAGDDEVGHADVVVARGDVAGPARRRPASPRHPRGRGGPDAIASSIAAARCCDCAGDSLASHAARPAWSRAIVMQRITAAGQWSAWHAPTSPAFIGSASFARDALGGVAPVGGHVTELAGDQGVDGRPQRAAVDWPGRRCRGRSPAGASPVGAAPRW